MKKILLSILFILIFTTINAQSPKKYDIAFPSWYTYQEVGDSLAPMVWIMNTSIPVTLDSVKIYQTNRNQLETNANLVVGGSDVANGNPVPVSDAGGSLTVDGTFWQTTQPVSATALDIRPLTAADTVTVNIPASGSLATEAKQDLAIDTLAALYVILNDVYDSATGTLKVIEQAPDKYTAVETLYTATAADTANTTWQYYGAEFSLLGYNSLCAWSDIDIGTSTDLQLQLCTRYETGGTDYKIPIATVSSTAINVDDETVIFPNADDNYQITWNLPSIAIPYGIFRYKASNNGGGGQIDEINIAKSRE